MKTNFRVGKTLTDSVEYALQERMMFLTSIAPHLFQTLWHDLVFSFWNPRFILFGKKCLREYTRARWSPSLPPPFSFIIRIENYLGCVVLIAGDSHVYIVHPEAKTSSIVRDNFFPIRSWCLLLLDQRCLGRLQEWMACVAPPCVQFYILSTYIMKNHEGIAHFACLSFHKNNSFTNMLFPSKTTSSMKTFL